MGKKGKERKDGKGKIYLPPRFRFGESGEGNNLSERRLSEWVHTGRQKTIVGGREIILQREPGDKAGVTWREGEIKGTNKARLPFVMPVNDAMPDEPL